MNQESEASPSGKKTLSKKPETGPTTPTSGGELLPPRPRVDDKAARLENELEYLKRKTDNSKFIASFVVAIVGLCFASTSIPWYAFTAVFLLTIILLISLAFHWDFPQVRKPLEDLLAWGMRNAPNGKDKSGDEE